MILHCLRCSKPWDTEGMTPGEGFTCACGAELEAPGADAPLPPCPPCPRCGPGTLLDPWHPEWAKLHTCGRCEGVLVSPGALQLLIRSPETRARIVSDLPEARWASRRRIASRLDDDAICPGCNAAMARHRFAGAGVIDTCLTHGSWFDPDELRQALQSCDAGLRSRSLEEEEAKRSWGTFSRQQLEEEAAQRDQLRLAGRLVGTAVPAVDILVTLGLFLTDD